MTPAPAASVIIPSFQSARTITDCLASIVNQHLDAPFEVIVADSGTDETAAIIARSYAQVRVLKSDSRLDPALARNWGAREARGPVLAFIDSDCVADQGWLSRMCAAINERNYDGVGGAIRNLGGSTSAGWAGYFCEFREFLPSGRAVETANLTLGNAAYRRSIFQNAGGFPGGYFPQEDQVFHARLVAAGARLLFDPSSVVTHAHRSTVPAFLAHQRRIGAANARVVIALGLQGAGIASRRWLAAALVPALATYRFARTLARCWAEERYLMIRRPAVAGLCWIGMVAWGIGFCSVGAQSLAGPPE